MTPASTDTTLKVGSYTATATLLVGSSDANETSVSMARIPLYLTTGEVPKRAAEAVGRNAGGQGGVPALGELVGDLRDHVVVGGTLLHGGGVAAPVHRDVPHPGRRHGGQHPGVGQAPMFQSDEQIAIVRDFLLSV